jgi:hypothetical protein
MFDDEELEDAFEWGPIHILHSYAWHAACGRIKGVRMALGLCLIDAIKSDKIDDVGAPAYVRVLSEAHDEGRRVRWD